MRRSPAAARSPRGGTPGPTRTGRSRTRRSKRWEPACTRRSDPPSSCGGTGTWAQATTASSQAGSHRLDLRSEEHTSELQSRGHLVYRLLLEKKKTARITALASMLLPSRVELPNGQNDHDGSHSLLRRIGVVCSASYQGVLRWTSAEVSGIV